MDADEYDLQAELPTPEELVALRGAADTAPRPREAVARGLERTILGVTVRREGEAIATGRVLGDDGTVYLVSDVVVHPDHQRRGLGSRVLERLLADLRERAPSGAYVYLLADVEGFYERFGFEPTRPASRAMYLRV